MVQHPWYFIASLSATSSQDSFGCGALVTLPLPCGSLALLLGTPLVFPCFHSLASWACFDGGSARYILVIPGNAYLACQRLSFARILREFLGAPLRSYLLGGMLVLIKALEEFGRVDFIAIGISFYCQNGCISCKTCRNIVLLLFKWQLLLVLSLLCIGVGKDIYI